MIFSILSDKDAVFIASKILEQDFENPTVFRIEESGIPIVKIWEENHPPESRDIVEIDGSFNIQSTFGHHCNMVEVYRFIISLIEQYKCEECNGTGWVISKTIRRTKKMCPICTGRAWLCESEKLLHYKSKFVRQYNFQEASLIFGVPAHMFRLMDKTKISIF